MIANDNRIDDSTYSPEQHDSGRYGGFVADGDVLVYDRENHDRWVQSDVAVQLEEAR